MEGNGNEPEFKQMEAEANEFAADVLIPPKDYSNFVANGSFYANEIEGFAKDMGIAPGVVVGRLQKEEHIKNSWHNGLRQKFRWKA